MSGGGVEYRRQVKGGVDEWRRIYTTTITK
jgi:hypothetical protein